MTASDHLVQTSRQIIDQGSKSFALAARIFDTDIYEHAIMLYAWCRYCDDEIDGQVLGHGQQSPSPEEQAKKLKRLREQTHDAMTNKTVNTPIFQSFQRVFQTCEIPKHYPTELLDGFEFDIERRTYATLNDTLQYCYHVAGTVGAMMAAIMGVRDAGIIHRAIDLGLAFQLTNICRDVLQDAADGRVYLPENWLEEAGVPIDAEAFPQHTQALSSVCGRLLDEADRYYESAEYGIAHLPFRCSWAVATAQSVYRDIGRLVRTQGYEAWATRASSGTRRKLWLAFIGLFRSFYGISIGRHQKTPRGQLWLPASATSDNADQL